MLYKIKFKWELLSGNSFPRSLNTHAPPPDPASPALADKHLTNRTLRLLGLPGRQAAPHTVQSGPAPPLPAQPAGAPRSPHVQHALPFPVTF